MTHADKRSCNECIFNEGEVCELSGDIANKRKCSPELRFPKALKQWIKENPEKAN
jgi:hypothetical protein